MDIIYKRLCIYSYMFKLKSPSKDSPFDAIHHSWHTQGPQAKSGPPPCFIRPGTLFLSSGSTELSLNC